MLFFYTNFTRNAFFSGEIYTAEIFYMATGRDKYQVWLQLPFYQNNVESIDLIWLTLHLLSCFDLNVFRDNYHGELVLACREAVADGKRVK